MGLSRLDVPVGCMHWKSAYSFCGDGTALSDDFAGEISIEATEGPIGIDTISSGLESVSFARLELELSFEVDEKSL